MYGSPMRTRTATPAQRSASLERDGLRRAMDNVISTAPPGLLLGALGALGRRSQMRQASRPETVRVVRGGTARAASCSERRQAVGVAGLRPAKATADQPASCQANTYSSASESQGFPRPYMIVRAVTSAMHQ